MDSLTKDAVNKYLAIRDTPTIKALKNSNKSLHLAGKIIETNISKINKIASKLRYKNPQLAHNLYPRFTNII